MSMMKIESHETAKAFRVNGVTIAKRHLRTLFDDEKMKDETRLHMLLTTVPSVYLSGGAEIIIALEEKRAKEEKKRGFGPVGYAAKKVLRLWTALKLTPGVAEAFTNVARELAGPDAQAFAKRKEKELGDKIKPDFVGDADGNNVVQFTPKKPTLH